MWRSALYPISFCLSIYLEKLLSQSKAIQKLFQRSRLGSSVCPERVLYRYLQCHKNWVLEQDNRGADDQTRTASPHTAILANETRFHFVRSRTRTIVACSCEPLRRNESTLERVSGAPIATVISRSNPCRLTQCDTLGAYMESAGVPEVCKCEQQVLHIDSAIPVAVSNKTTNGLLGLCNTSVAGHVNVCVDHNPAVCALG